MADIKEECGVFGLFAENTTDVSSIVYRGLYALQHRGQESCGITVNDDGVFSTYKDLGLVCDVFSADKLKALGKGNMAIGHVRYATTGTNDRNNAQPIVVNHSKGRMALAHNGNLTNSYELRCEFEENGSIFHTTSDTEVISYTVTQERIRSKSIEEAVCKTMYRLKGAYSLLVMSPAKMIAVRDKHGFHPLCYGQMPDGTYIVASESCALDSVGAKFIRDIKPGEIVIFSKDGIKSIEEHCNTVPKSTCVFEYIYFARPDSVIDGVSVHNARVKAGEYLYEE
ncbi:MAG: amidophosphoribosyltransferase, partial [Monoglobaceae bacterium]